MMKAGVEEAIKSACQSLFGQSPEVVLTRPSDKLGDFSTNVALVLAPTVQKPPMEIAQAISSALTGGVIETANAAEPGFINIKVTDQAIFEACQNPSNSSKLNAGKQVLIEFGDANPFKEMHLGHLYDSIVGDGLANLLEASGAEVKRLSYHGDVGLHVAKWIWSAGNSIEWDMNRLAELAKQPIGYYYSEGSKAFDNDPKVADEIRAINEHIYRRDDENVNQLYEYGKKLSFEQFDKTFAELKIKHDKRYFESETAEIGLQTVKDHIGSVFEESEGAVIYRGEKDKLHNQVFITSKQLPTYQTKELGLSELKKRDYPAASESIIITASEQAAYFLVIERVLTQVDPTLAEITRHIAHGFLSLKSGKMSSRSGDVYTATSLLGAIRDQVEQQFSESPAKDDIYLAAIKYTLLKHKIGPDIVFDVKDSISLDGNSGPYIQYAYARAQSILAKVGNVTYPDKTEWQPDERRLAFKVSEFQEVVTRAINDNLPHHICIYLYELSQIFNNFYENNRVVDDPRSITRSQLVKFYAEVLEKGLSLLNIAAPKRV